MTAIAAFALFEMTPLRKIQNPRLTQMTSVQTMEVELATLVCFSDSNHKAKWTARNNPLKQLKIISVDAAWVISCRKPFLPSTTGVRRITVHSSRHAAVTEEGAGEYFTKIDDKDIPITPMMIMMNGCFSKYFIWSFHSFWLISTSIAQLKTKRNYVWKYAVKM